MINDENAKYLIDKFNIDINKYSKEELNSILDEIIDILNKSIKNKLNTVKQIRDEVGNV